jgi:hypothetical protein
MGKWHCEVIEVELKKRNYPMGWIFFFFFLKSDLFDFEDGIKWKEISKKVS